MALRVPSYQTPWTHHFVVELLLTETYNQLRDDCWIVLNGKVYDMTEFMDDHPGGSKVVMLYAGKDATDEFTMLHKPAILKKFGPRLHIGSVSN